MRLTPVSLMALSVLTILVVAASTRPQEGVSNDSKNDDAMAADLARGLIAPAESSQDPTKPSPAAANLTGLHDFDFQVGDWRVNHRVKRSGDSQELLEFDGTCSNRRLMDGWANVEDHMFNKPTGVSRGLALRAYDPKSGLWAIWWIDGRNPFGDLDPPVKGRFDNGVGTFYSDGTLAGKPIRTRFVWSHITPTSARWEQAYSSDAGKTWETNWIMEFRRVLPPKTSSGL